MAGRRARDLVFGMKHPKASMTALFSGCGSKITAVFIVVFVVWLLVRRVRGEA